MPAGSMIWVLWFSAIACATALTPVHVAFLTDCTRYSDWQALGMVFSFKMSGQPGKVTRVMCCSEEQRQSYPAELLKEVETHIAPSFTIHPITGDEYAAYNKPEAVIHWLQHVTPEEQYILVLDSDMILRRPFLVEVMQPKPGLAIGAQYTYMIGVNNELALRHVPEVLPRNDTLAGPLGRRGDQVGGFFFIDRGDLKRLSSLWLEYTEDVRDDPMAYKYSGDAYAVNPGDRPWISEMYGYSFGAAKANVWHKWDTQSMVYPGDEPSGLPKLMHYGLLVEVSSSYRFDKAWFPDFDITACPPWTLSDPKQIKAGLFAHPPSPGSLTNQDHIGEYYRDLLSIETIATLNAAFCDYHLRHCPPSQQLYDECRKALQIYKEVTAAASKTEEIYGCTDHHDKCIKWAEAGECSRNKGYMAETCRKSCDACIQLVGMSQGLQPEGTALEQNLVELGKQLPRLKQTAAAADPPTVPQVLQVPALNPKDADVSVEVPAAAAAINVASPTAPQIRRKELVIRCYRMMSLRPEEIKACIAAAKDGVEYKSKTKAFTLSPEVQPAAVPPAVHAQVAQGQEVAAVAFQSQTDITHTASQRIPATVQQSPSSARMILMLGSVAVVLLILLFLCLNRQLFRTRTKSRMRLD